jgi:hypothetical protein
MMEAVGTEDGWKQPKVMESKRQRAIQQTGAPCWELGSGQSRVAHAQRLKVATAKACGEAGSVKRMREMGDAMVREVCLMREDNLKRLED